MDNRAEIRAFLTTRRGKVTPESAGLTAYGNRRVPGLRRGEVAMLAGVSVEYYTRLERGSLRGVSDSVLDALARALQLTETEHSHLNDLARKPLGDASCVATMMRPFSMLGSFSNHKHRPSPREIDQRERCSERRTR